MYAVRFERFNGYAELIFQTEPIWSDEVRIETYAQSKYVQLDAVKIFGNTGKG